MTDRTIELIIYDCDGTLIDSEVVACSVQSERLAELGVTVSPGEVARLYAGLSHSEIVRRLQRDFSVVLPADYMVRVREAITRRLARDAVTLPGVEEVLDRITLPICLATSAHPDKLEVELRKTELWDRFWPHIFRGDMVDRSKPAPDLFLLAADRMAVAPDRCLVVEDSVHGIEAARAAGMLAVGYIGGSHCAAGQDLELTRAGAQVVMRDHRELLALL